MRYFIYKYEWNDGSIYIGQSNHNNHRFGNISSYRKTMVYNKMKKDSNFSKEIIQDNISEEKIDELERYYIKKFNSFHDNNPRGWNFTMGGHSTHSYSKESKEKMRKAHLGKTPNNKGVKLTKESKDKIAEAFSKITLQYDMNNNFIKEWISAKVAAENLNITHSNITRCCRGERKSAGGFKWVYKNT